MDMSVVSLVDTFSLIDILIAHAGLTQYTISSRPVYHPLGVTMLKSWVRRGSFRHLRKTTGYDMRRGIVLMPVSMSGHESRAGRGTSHQKRGRMSTVSLLPLNAYMRTVWNQRDPRSITLT